MISVQTSRFKNVRSHIKYRFLICTHLKLWVAVARHDLKWVKIQIIKFSALGVKVCDLQYPEGLVIERRPTIAASSRRLQPALFRTRNKMPPRFSGDCHRGDKRFPVSAWPPQTFLVMWAFPRLRGQCPLWSAAGDKLQAGGGEWFSNCPLLLKRRCNKVCRVAVSWLHILDD